MGLQTGPFAFLLQRGAPPPAPRSLRPALHGVPGPTLFSPKGDGFPDVDPSEVDDGSPVEPSRPFIDGLRHHRIQEGDAD
jgi:hypothetical protein